MQQDFAANILLIALLYVYQVLLLFEVFLNVHRRLVEFSIYEFALNLDELFAIVKLFVLHRLSLTVLAGRLERLKIVSGS